MLSQTSAYAVRAVVHLASGQAAEGFVRVGEIAGALGVPRNYLSKILHQLARAGVLESGRGPRGGFRLAVAVRDLRLAEIVEAVAPGEASRRCLLGRPECTDQDPCPLHERWRGLADGIEEFLHGTTVADLLQPGARARRASADEGGTS